MDEVRYRCDHCDRLIKKPNSCFDCGPCCHYHVRCSKKVAGNNYCFSHAEDHIGDRILIAYLNKACKALKLKDTEVDMSELLSRGVVKLSFGPRETFNLKAGFNSSENSIQISDGQNVHNISIDNHDSLISTIRRLCFNVISNKLKHSIAVEKQATSERRRREEILHRFIGDKHAKNAL